MFEWLKRRIKNRATPGADGRTPADELTSDCLNIMLIAATQNPGASFIQTCDTMRDILRTQVPHIAHRHGTSEKRVYQRFALVLSQRAVKSIRLCFPWRLNCPACGAELLIGENASLFSTEQQLEAYAKLTGSAADTAAAESMRDCVSRLEDTEQQKDLEGFIWDNLRSATTVQLDIASGKARTWVCSQCAKTGNVTLHNYPQVKAVSV